MRECDLGITMTTAQPHDINSITANSLLVNYLDTSMRDLMADYPLISYSLQDYADHELNNIYSVMLPFSGVPLTEPCCSRTSPSFPF